MAQTLAAVFDRHLTQYTSQYLINVSGTKAKPVRSLGLIIKMEVVDQQLEITRTVSPGSTRLETLRFDRQLKVIVLDGYFGALAFSRSDITRSMWIVHAEAIFPITHLR